MDIMQIWNAYQKDADPETIFPMYQQCALNATVSGYGDADLLNIASRNAHPEAVAWLLESGFRVWGAAAAPSGAKELFLQLCPAAGGYLPLRTGAAGRRGRHVAA